MDSRADTMKARAVQEPLPVHLEDSQHNPLSPKRPAVETAGLADIFPYYAGFSFDWACTELGRHDPSLGLVVLDPWNGSGTTTLAAQAIGHRSIGIDLNPVANTVALLRGTAQIPPTRLKPPRRSAKLQRAAHSDPLEAWFTSQTASRLRQWANAAHQDKTALSAVVLIAVFRAVRSLTSSFQGSNPTWVKVAKDSTDLLEVSTEEIDKLVSEEQAFLLERMQSSPAMKTPTLIAESSSNKMPLADNSIDLIVTSPPYLTRIDYAVAYVRELAVLGIDLRRDRSLRAALMGTTLIREPGAIDDSRFGDLAQALIRDVSGHSSWSSQSYYLKQVRQYLTDLTSGLEEITRVARSGASMKLVVQDSFYKDVHVPLANICIEEVCNRGWMIEQDKRWPVRRTLTSLNKNAKAYAKSEVSEAVMEFVKK